MTKEIVHFKNPDVVFQLLQQIRSRHKTGYYSLLKHLIIQIESYYFRSQKLTKGGEAAPLKFIIALSGGLDSTVGTFLATKAVGPENILPVTMPARTDDKECVEKAKLVRKQLRIADPSMQYVIPILDIVNTEVSLINGVGKDKLKINTNIDTQSFEDKIRIGNFASRTRIAILYDLSKKLNGRVLGTANRTEFVQGFAAKYGTPISYDFGLLDDLYKVDIIEIAKLLGIPKKIMNSVPSTGYFRGQTHEKELGATLEEQDVVAYLLFEKKLKKEDIIAKYGADEDYIQLMLDKYKKCAHKRMLRQKHIQIGKYPCWKN